MDSETNGFVEEKEMNWMGRKVRCGQLTRQESTRQEVTNKQPQTGNNKQAAPDRKYQTGSSPRQEVTNKQPQTGSNKQVVTSSTRQKVTNKQHQTGSNKQAATNKQHQTGSNKQEAAPDRK